MTQILLYYFNYYNIIMINLKFILSNYIYSSMLKKMKIIFYFISI